MPVCDMKLLTPLPVHTCVYHQVSGASYPLANKSRQSTSSRLWVLMGGPSRLRSVSSRSEVEDRRKCPEARRPSQGGVAVWRFF